MPVIVIGLNHKTAPVNVREKIAFSPTECGQGLLELKQIVSERVIVSTCNRTEIYLATKGKEDKIPSLLEWLARFKGIEHKQLVPYLYIHKDDTAVQHILRVVCGLDSMVLGEPQIFGQVKDAHALAFKHNASGAMLNRLMQYSFNIAKKIRTQTAIGANPVSVAYAAVSLSKQIFTRLEEQNALLVGAGETIELVGRHLITHGIGHITVANRSLDNAQKLAKQFSGDAITLDQIANQLVKSDIVISSTAAPIPIIGKGSVEKALKKRKHSPIFMVDIAVPRDIEAEVSTLDDVYLYTVDDLQSVIKSNMKSRQDAAERAEIMVNQEVGAYMEWLQAQKQMGLIKTYRDDANIMRQETLAKALRHLKNGKSAEEALTFLAHTLTNKLTHNATAAMNKAAHRGDRELLDFARQILNLKKNKL